MEFEIKEFGAILEESNNGWKVEVNKVSWFGKDPKWDIRPWNEDHTKCGKGMTLSELAIKSFYEYLKEIYKEG